MIEIYIPNGGEGILYIVNTFREATPAAAVHAHVGTNRDGSSNIDKVTYIDLDNGQRIALNPVTKRKALFFIHPGYLHA